MCNSFNYDNLFHQTLYLIVSLLLYLCINNVSVSYVFMYRTSFYLRYFYINTLSFDCGNSFEYHGNSDHNFSECSFLLVRAFQTIPNSYDNRAFLRIFFSLFKWSCLWCVIFRFRLFLSRLRIIYIHQVKSRWHNFHLSQGNIPLMIFYISRYYIFRE